MAHQQLATSLPVPLLAPRRLVHSPPPPPPHLPGLSDAIASTNSTPVENDYLCANAASNAKYDAVKSDKRAELLARLQEKSLSYSSEGPSPKAKKGIDNNASAVASRFRVSEMIAQLGAALRRREAESRALVAGLDDAVRHARALEKQVADLRQENDRIKRECTCPPPGPPPERAAFEGDDENLFQGMTYAPAPPQAEGGIDPGLGFGLKGTWTSTPRPAYHVGEGGHVALGGAPRGHAAPGGDSCSGGFLGIGGFAPSA